MALCVTGVEVLKIIIIIAVIVNSVLWKKVEGKWVIALEIKDCYSCYSILWKKVERKWVIALEIKDFSVEKVAFFPIQIFEM